MKECHYIRKSTFLCVMVFCASGLATSARLLISLEIEWFHLKPFDLPPLPIEWLHHPPPPGRGLNEIMPLHKEIDVSLCNGILRICSARLEKSSSRVRGLNKECSAHLFGGLDGPLRKEIDVSLCHGILCMCSAGLETSSSGR